VKYVHIEQLTQKQMEQSKLIFKEIEMWGKKYKVLIPQNPKEFIYGLYNDLLSIGKPTEVVPQQDLFDLRTMLLRLN
jgi:hypothetical protein